MLRGPRLHPLSLPQLTETKGESLKCNNISRIPEDITSTGKLQQWNVPAKREVQPSSVADITFAKVQYGKVAKVKSTRISDKSPNVSNTNERVKALIVTMSQVCPQSGLLHFWGNSEPEIDVVNEQPATQGDPLEEEANKRIIYQSYVNASIDD